MVLSSASFSTSWTGIVFKCPVMARAANLWLLPALPRLFWKSRLQGRFSVLNYCSSCCDIGAAQGGLVLSPVSARKDVKNSASIDYFLCNISDMQVESKLSIICDTQKLRILCWFNSRSANVHVQYVFAFFCVGGKETAFTFLYRERERVLI